MGLEDDRASYPWLLPFLMSLVAVIYTDTVFRFEDSSNSAIEMLLNLTVFMRKRLSGR